MQRKYNQMMGMRSNDGDVAVYDDADDNSRRRQRANQWVRFA